MKKVLALLLIAVMCCGVFAACSSPAAETPSEPTTTEETPATTGDADAASLVSDAFINPTADWGQYNDLITQIKTETDYAKRTELMHKAEDILMSNYCILPFYYYNDLYMQKDYVDGIYANLFQTKFFMYATMSNGSDTLRLNLASEPDFRIPPSTAPLTAPAWQPTPSPAFTPTTQRATPFPPAPPATPYPTTA